MFYLCYKYLNLFLKTQLFVRFGPIFAIVLMFFSGKGPKLLTKTLICQHFKQFYVFFACYLTKM